MVWAAAFQGRYSRYNKKEAIQGNICNIFFIAAHVNVWQSDHGRQPGLLQSSAGNSPEDNANERCEEEAESNHLFLQKAAPLPALDLAIVLKELTIAGFNVYR